MPSPSRNRFGAAFDRKVAAYKRQYPGHKIEQCDIDFTACDCLLFHYSGIPCTLIAKEDGPRGKPRPAFCLGCGKEFEWRHA